MKVMKHFLKGNQVGEVHASDDEALSEGGIELEKCIISKRNCIWKPIRF
ncbi:hypothetical protein [Lysinibacillus sp. SGAir0095]|nr:hypothetical protein [Lysinibacillus sp. SGAir0095]